MVTKKKSALEDAQAELGALAKSLGGYTMRERKAIKILSGVSPSGASADDFISEEFLSAIYVVLTQRTNPSFGPDDVDLMSYNDVLTGLGLPSVVALENE